MCNASVKTHSYLQLSAILVWWGVLRLESLWWARTSADILLHGPSQCTQRLSVSLAPSGNQQLVTEKHVTLQVDLLARLLMPPGIEALRGMLHATAVEVLLYLTPSHCHDMLTSLIASMNSTYAKFMRRYPGFKVRHSLHSVFPALL